MKAEKLQSTTPGGSEVISAANQAADLKPLLYLVLNQCCQWKIVKQVCEEFPDIGIAIFPQALIIEAISAQICAAETVYPVSAWTANPFK